LDLDLDLDLDFDLVSSHPEHIPSE